MSELIDTFVKFSNFMSPEWWLLTACFVPRGGFLYTIIVPGEGFCPLRVMSRGFSGGGWFWTKFIAA